METNTLTIAGISGFIFITVVGTVIKAWVNGAIESAHKAREKEQETLELLERDLQALKDRTLMVETKMVDETQTRRIIGEAVASLKVDINSLSGQMQELLQAIISNRG